MRHSLRSLTATLTLCLGACGAEQPIEVSLATLAQFQEEFNGRHIIASGTLQSHPRPEHFWIEDDDYNRVALTPNAQLSGRVGQRLRVEGTYTYDQGTGRLLRVKSIAPVTP